MGRIDRDVTHRLGGELPKGIDQLNQVYLENLCQFQQRVDRDRTALLKPYDVFFYVYGLLHSPDYKEQFADDLAKEMPRVPCVRDADDFRSFSAAGRQLVMLHTRYDMAELYPVKITGASNGQRSDFHVEKMRYAKHAGGKDLATIHVNKRVAITGIPIEAYKYVVNGKPALDWIIERQGVSVDKESGITNDASAWATETMQNPRYPVELLQRVITVSLETVRVVSELPTLDL